MPQGILYGSLVKVGIRGGIDRQVLREYPASRQEIRSLTNHLANVTANADVGLYPGCFSSYQKYRMVCVLSN